MLAPLELKRVYPLGRLPILQNDWLPLIETAPSDDAGGNPAPPQFLHYVEG